MRRLLPLTHDQYLDEPADLVDWFLAFAEQDQDMEREANERAARQRR